MTALELLSSLGFGFAREASAFFDRLAGRPKSGSGSERKALRAARTRALSAFASAFASADLTEDRRTFFSGAERVAAGGDATGFSAGALIDSATAFTTSRSALPAPARAPVAAAAPEMKFRVCDLTGKRRNAKAMTVTFSHTRNHKVQQVNLQDRRLWWPEGDKYVKMRLSTRALKTIAKYGLNTAAKKYDVDLEQFAR